MEKPVHPADLGIINITLDDLYEYAEQMDAFNQSKAFVPLAYVSAIPACPPANFPAPLPPQNAVLSLVELPKQIRPCTLLAQPPLWSRKRASSCRK